MSERQQILIVDDRVENLVALEEVLDELEVDFVRAMDGNEAVSKTLRRQYALILMDIQMPGMDGFEAVELIRKERKNKLTPVIFLSAIYRDDIFKVKGVQAGAVDFITKPINEDILIGKVRIFLQLHQQKIELEAVNAQLRDANAILSRLAQIDGLTGLVNRRYFEESLAREWRRLARDGEEISVLMIDIDHFKPYNDAYGHQQGDDCLKQVAVVLQQSPKRPGDFVARYGGEEFIVVLPETGVTGAMQLAEEMCARVVGLQIPHCASETSPYVTVSIGCACVNAVPGKSVDALISLADQALYRAKATGRNRVEG